MKIIKLVLILIALACWVYPINILAQEIKSNETPNPTPTPQVAQPPKNASPLPKPISPTQIRTDNGRHNLKAEKQIDISSLRAFLLHNKSPLADYADQIAQSPYYGAIIGIANAEEGLTINPYGSNNFYGIMEQGRIKRFATIGEGITAIGELLNRYETRGHATVESLRGIYCQSQCTNWESTVLKTKSQVENLK